MNQKVPLDRQTPMTLELFQPRPNVFYSLDATAELAGVTRRTILMYCRAGLVQPIFQPPYGVMEFTDETILTVRRLEHLRRVHGLDVAWLRTMAKLLEEVERLRAELRFWRRP
jgi:DNA-binding transcriptional MerR regulator